MSQLEIKTLPDNFFGNTTTDVIGLIGKNGAGKSNIIELVCNVLKGSKGYFKSDYLIVTEQNGVFTCHVSFFGTREMPTSNVQVKFEDYQGSMNAVKVVYFSNVHTNRKIEFGKDVADISVGATWILMT